MKIGIMGCGNMGSCIAKRLAHTAQVAVFDRHPEKLTWHKTFPQVKICHDLSELFSSADSIFLAVKPYDLEKAALQIKPYLQQRHILVSVLAGATISQLKTLLGNSTLIIRMMPNLAVEYGQGVIGLTADLDISSDKKQQLSDLLSIMGRIVWLEETKMNALTALAGSGPAFLLIVIEAMIDAGIAMGFNSTDAKDIILQTLLGTHALMHHTGKHPAELCWQITSPAGTTIAGKIALEEANIRSGIIKTILAAFNRAKELSPSV